MSTFRDERIQGGGEERSFVEEGEGGEEEWKEEELGLEVRQRATESRSRTNDEDVG